MANTYAINQSNSQYDGIKCNVMYSVHIRDNGASTTRLPMPIWFWLNRKIRVASSEMRVERWMKIAKYLSEVELYCSPNNRSLCDGDRDGQIHNNKNTHGRENIFNAHFTSGAKRFQRFQRFQSHFCHFLFDYYYEIFLIEPDVYGVYGMWVCIYIDLC